MTTTQLADVAEAIPFADGNVIYRNDTGAITFWRDGSWRESRVDVVPEADCTAPNCVEPSFGAKADLRVNLGFQGVRVRSHDEAHARWLKALISDHCSFDDQPVAGEIALFSGKGDWWVAVSSEPVQQFESLPAAHWYLIRSIWRICHPGVEWLALLHASAVAIDERPIIFAGTSGSGKSSLAAHLVAHGAQHLTDDIVPIDADKRAVWPVPTRASVKLGSWQALAAVWKQIAVGEAYSFQDGAVRLVDIDPIRRGHQPLSNKPLVIFPLFEPDAQTKSVSIDPVALLAGLGNTGTIYPDDPDLLRCFLHWAESVDGFIVNYPNSGKAHEEINKILRDLS